MSCINWIKDLFSSEEKKFFPRTCDARGKSDKFAVHAPRLVQTSSFPRTLPPQTTASQGLSLNRSQYGGCSTKYNTPAGTQVVYRRFEGEQVVFPESSHKTNSSQSSSLTPAICPGVRLAGTVDATPLAKRRESTALC